MGSLVICLFCRLCIGFIHVIMERNPHSPYDMFNRPGSIPGARSLIIMGTDFCGLYSWALPSLHLSCLKSQLCAYSDEKRECHANSLPFICRWTNVAQEIKIIVLFKNTQTQRFHPFHFGAHTLSWSLVTTLLLSRNSHRCRCEEPNICVYYVVWIGQLAFWLHRYWWRGQEGCHA